MMPYFALLLVPFVSGTEICADDQSANNNENVVMLQPAKRNLTTMVGELKELSKPFGAEPMTVLMGSHTASAARLSEDFVAASETLGLDPVTEKLLKSFRIRGVCKHFLRLGEENDGGYLTCMDGSEDVVGALSLGVENHDQWTLDLHKMLGVNVGQFDCTVNEGTDCGGDCQFFQKCIGSNSENPELSELKPMITLTEALKTMNFDKAAEGSVLLKMDIEGSEWPIFEVEPLEVMSKFSQIILEVHSLKTTDKHNQMLAAMSNLQNSGFYVAHLHGNNCCGMYNVGEFSVPNYLEVTFVRMKGEESKSWDLLDEDAPNLAWKEEVSGAHLPL